MEPKHGAADHLYKEFSDVSPQAPALFNHYHAYEHPEQKNNGLPPITRDDEALLEVMLGAGYGSLYERLVNANRYRLLTPEEQQRSQAGMLELFATEMNNISFREPGIWGARAGMARLMNTDEPEGKEFYRETVRSGRRLMYQNVGMQHAGDLTSRGDFLHFGVAFDYEGYEDRLSNYIRIYATPKMDAVGHIGAEVIRKTREKGMEVYGKVWDESTDNDSANCRTDRLIFYGRLQRQIDGILDSLREIEATEHDLFEDVPPLLCEATDIRGVGIAEDPPESVSKSFHETRADLLQLAWGQVLDKFAPATVEESKDIYFSEIPRARRLKQQLRTDKQLGRNVIYTFRQTIRDLSEENGVAAGRFAMNLARE